MMAVIVTGTNSNSYEGANANTQVCTTGRTRRGASALEGFHAHQKSWLGKHSTHTCMHGLALVADGTVRWNASREKHISVRNATLPASSNRSLKRGIHERPNVHPCISYVDRCVAAGVCSTSPVRSLIDADDFYGGILGKNDDDAHKAIESAIANVRHQEEEAATLPLQILALLLRLLLPRLRPSPLLF